MILRGKDERYVGDATLISFHTDERPLGIDVNIKKRASGVGTYKDAIDLLKQYKIWDECPESVRKYLEKSDPRYAHIKPGEMDGKPHYHFRVMGPEYMLEAAKRKAKELGINCAIIASSLSDVEATAVGNTLAYMAREIEIFGRPFKPPCVLIFGGELIVTVGGKKGIGGRNQEFVLSAAPRIGGSKNIVIASCDSDGTDGPTDAAGGVIDGYTMARAEKQGIRILEELDKHNSYNALLKLGDLIFTGARGTNVQDLRLVYIGNVEKNQGKLLPDYVKSLFPKQ
jgi:glycerate 2-kinase